MRILIVCNTCPPRFVGGAELVAIEQAVTLKKMGHDVCVFAGDIASPEPRYARSDDVYQGLPIHRIATVPEDYSAEFLNFFHPRIDEHFRSVLGEFKPDIVHCHNLIGLSVKIPIIAAQSGARVVCTLHDFWSFCLRNTAIRADGKTCDDTTQCRSCLPVLHDGRGLRIPLRFRKDFMRFALDHVDQFVAPSHFVADRHAWAGFPEQRIAVIPNGIDVDRFRPRNLSSTQIPQIAYIGYLGAHKGVATLIAAMARLPQGMKARLLLVGEGPEKANYLKQIEALGLAECVNFAGKILPAEMHIIYAGSDIVVLPSIWDENQPVCLMEAMASGLPVIASRKGGIPELIEHGENGFLFEAGDAADLADHLARLISDPTLRGVIGAKGRLRVEALTPLRQAERLIEVYVQALSAPRRTYCSNEIFAVLDDFDKFTKRDGDILSFNCAMERKKSRIRYFIPIEWIGDCRPIFSGIVMARWFRRIMGFFGVEPSLRFPKFIRGLGAAALALRATSRVASRSTNENLQ